VVLAQEAIHRGLRAQVAALVEQDRVHLARRQVDKPFLVQHREHLGPFGRRESPWPRLGIPHRPWRHRALAVPTVVGRAGTSHRSAGVLDAHHRSQFGDRLIERGLDHRSLSLWLLPAARVSNRAESFDRTSITRRAVAWDIDEHYRRTGTELRDAESVELILEHEHRASVRVNRRFGASSISQVLTLEGDSAALDIVTAVDWHERQKMLKLTFPLDVHADRAASEIQFGHVYRPTHANTSWDAARFETCAHRWVHVGEPWLRGGHREQLHLRS